jgi:5-methyltetrahydropteroyltriglutamate--homocysteine methyltransferase
VGGAPGQRWDPGYSGSGPGVIHRRPVNQRLFTKRNLPLEEFSFTQGLTHRPVKVTLIGPDRISQRFDWQDAASQAVYADRWQFLDDVVRIEREMIASLVTAGCRYVHIDEPGLTAYADGPSLTEMVSRGEDPSQNLARSIAADNAVIADFPDVTFGVHLCRGNQAGMWHREGSYDAIAEQVFAETHFQRLLLEYDTERAGTFEALRFVPPGRVVVLGLVSTKSRRVEGVDEVLRRIEAASHYLPIEQLAVSPQCGFASDIVGNPLSEDDQWRKLEVVQQVAEVVWGRGARGCITIHV